ncbi:MAG: radical SAM protein [Pseudomonadota bacterium]
MSGNGIILVQLPVPEPAPRRSTGLAPLGPACLLLHAGTKSGAGIAPLDLLRRGGDAQLLDGIVALEPRILALSMNVWNVERSLALAAALRERRPGTEVWLGGPEVAADAWFAEDPGAPFDLAINGEGEVAFASLLQGIPPDRIPGLWRPGRPVTAAAPPLADLSTIHDPYMAGLVTAEADGVVLAELWRGCRYRCAFCAYPQGRRGHLAAARPDAQARSLFRWARGRDIREIYLLDPSLEQRPDLEALLRLLAELQGETPIPLFAELRAEAVTSALAADLARAGVSMVETGLQTLTVAALAGMGRSLSPDRFAEGLRALSGAGIRAKIDLMLGLPGDTEDGLRRTLDFLTDLGAAGNLQVFRTQVLPGTPLRGRAAGLGVLWEPRPPYRILETPTWQAHALSEAVSLVEDATGEALTTLPGPVLTVPPRTPAHRRSYLDAAAVLQYSWDLSRPGAVADLAGEDFRNAGRWTAVWFRTQDPAGDTGSIVAGIRRLVHANPFCGQFVALELPPGAPLEPVFALDEALDEGRPSTYLEGLLDAGHRPDRRLGVVLRFEDRSRLSGDWLETVHALAEVIWLLPVRDAAEAAERGGDALLWEGEYLLLDLPPGAPLPDPGVFPDPYSVLLSGTERHWAWVEMLDRGAGTDF